MNDPMVESLLAEREGYARRGLEDRVAQVDEQLRLRGHEVEAQTSPETSPAEQRAASQGEGEAPKRRGPKPRATAEQQDKTES